MTTSVLLKIDMWLEHIGIQYHVNPYIFAAIYIGAIPLFSLSIIWLIKNIRNGKTVVFPILSAGFFFVSSYVYLLIVGQNIPVWVYILIAVLVVYGIYSTLSKVKVSIQK